MTDEISEIHSRINIVDLASQRVSLKRSGKNFVGLCPFHDDKNPSFSVNPATNRYICWSCGAKGDIFNWVMQTQNVEFAEALRFLAEQAGVTLKAQKAPIEKSVVEMRRAAMSEALKFFRDQLKKSSVAQKYCEDRGIEPQTLDDWEVGYAPDAGDALAVALKKKGFNLAACKELFLVDEDSSGGFFDRFRGRLMFPIRDEREELVAFGGRILGSGQPKYINSGDTPLYRKSRVLYGFHRAKESLGKGERIILCEGYLDVIACHRAGATTAVASLGTSLTPDHAKLMKRWCESVLVLYDQDAAGQKAADRAIEILNEAGLRVQIALMPEGEDPDTLLRKEGPGGIQRVVAGGQSPLDFRLQKLEELFKPSEQAFWDRLVETLAQAPNELELDKHIVKYAHQFPGHSEPSSAQRALRKEVQRHKRALQQWKVAEHAQDRPLAIVQSAHVAINRAESVVLSAFLSEEFRPQAYQAIAGEPLFTTPTAQQVAEQIAKSFPSEPPQGEAKTWLHLLEASAQETLADLYQDETIGPLEPQLADCIAKLKMDTEKRRIRVGLVNSQDDASKNDLIAQIAKLKGVQK